LPTIYLPLKKNLKKLSDSQHVLLYFLNREHLLYSIAKSRYQLDLDSVQRGRPSHGK